jgi:hypothetical protein
MKYVINYKVRKAVDGRKYPAVDVYKMVRFLFRRFLILPHWHVARGRERMRREKVRKERVREKEGESF